MSDLRDQIAALSAIATDLDAYMERRAAELAQPLIEKAYDEAVRRFSEAEFEVTRQNDLIAELRRQIEHAHHRIDRQVERGDRLTDQVRTIRTLQAMYAKLGVHGMPGQREVFARVAEDLGKVLDPPAPGPHDALAKDLEAAIARHANDHIGALAQPGDQPKGT